MAFSQRSRPEWAQTQTPYVWTGESQLAPLRFLDVMCLSPGHAEVAGPSVQTGHHHCHKEARLIMSSDITNKTLGR